MHLYLRAMVPKLRLSGVRPAPLSEEGSIHLDPRICWAMELREFERVEVHNVTRCLRFAAHVRFGREGDAVVTQATGPLMQRGDTLRLSAVAWRPSEKRHSALLVLVDEGNAPREIRRVIARMADLDPVSFPLPAAIEHVTRIAPAVLPLLEATD